MKSIVDLLGALSRLLINDKKTESVTDDFNLFKVLGVETKEVIICRFIGNLLDSSECHNLGILPLKKFFEKVLKVDVSDFELQKATIELEEKIDNKRRVDIAIYIGDTVYPIEVKVWAYDQEAQLYDYYNYYKKRNEINKIFYLTPTGKKPSEKSKLSLSNDKFSCISFVELYEWLVSIEPENACNLKTSVKQLKEIIRAMNIKNEKIQFIREVLDIENVDNYFNNDNLKSAIALFNNKEVLIREIMQNYLYSKIVVGNTKKYKVCRIEKADSKKTFLTQALLEIFDTEINETVAWICVSANLYIAAQSVKSVKGKSKWKKEGNEYYWKYLSPEGGKTPYPLKKLECILENDGKIDIKSHLEEIIVD